MQIILDLDGTLVFSEKSKTNYSNVVFETLDGKEEKMKVIKRPYLSLFLNYLMENHKVGIWSSAQPNYVNSICEFIFTDTQLKELSFIYNWTNLSRENGHLYKRIDWSPFGRENTIIVEDDINFVNDEDMPICFSIKSYKGKKNDKELLKLMSIIKLL